MILKNILKDVGIKGVFNTIFPKAKNTKVGRAVSSFVNGATESTPLTIVKSLATSFFDSNKDGKITAEDFKGMSSDTFFKVMGFIVGCFLMLFLSAKFTPKLFDILISLL